MKSKNSIKSYLDYFEQSYLFFYLKKFDYSVKQQIMNSRKVYSLDPAQSNRLGFHFTGDKGRLLETVVYLQLLRRKRDVFYHSGKKECDFVVQEGLIVTPVIQVVYDFHDTNCEREIEGLQEAMASYSISKGLLIVGENRVKNEVIPETIDVIPAWKWLLSTAN